MTDGGQLELRNPLVLATIAMVSLGSSLIAWQHAGETVAWLVGAPAALAAVGILYYALPALGFVAKVAARDVRALAPSTRDTPRRGGDP